MTDEINTLTEIRRAYKRAMVNASYFEMLECQKAIKALEDAESALRDRIAHQNPQPLTLDELRSMDGEPVWIVDAGASENNGWYLVNLKYEPFFDKPDVTWEALMGNDGQYFTMCQVGNGLIAYRTKPEPPEREVQV